jgi:hypothetical protein
LSGAAPRDDRLHPNQFQVNEAWVAFKLNDQPLHTEQDGDLDVFALMDAASCFIFSSGPVSAKRGEPSKLESRRLLKQGKAYKERWTKTLFVPSEQPASPIVDEAERQGIGVVRIPEDQLLPFIGEAREGFREHFS